MDARDFDLAAPKAPVGTRGPLPYSSFVKMA